MQIPNTRYQIPDTEYQIQNARYQISNIRYPVLDACRVPEDQRIRLETSVVSQPTRKPVRTPESSRMGA